jgi:hypothetical protein
MVVLGNLPIKFQEFKTSLETQKNTKRKVMLASANQDKNTKKGATTSCTN